MTVTPSAVPPTSTPTMAPTETPRPSITPGPTETSVPTSVPTATRTATRTSTPGATATRPPTSSPMPTADVAGGAYVAAIAEITRAYGVALTGIGEQSTAAGKNALLMLDESWKLKTAIYLVSLKLQGQELRKLQPPARFAEVHALLLVAAGHFDRSAEFYADGVDQLSGDKLGQAVAEMRLGSAAVEAATGRLKALR